jgi:amino acid transporter
MVKALSSSSEPPSPLAFKLAAFGSLTLTTLIHGYTIKWGVRLQNLLAISKIMVLLIVIGSGVFALTGGLQGEMGPEGVRGSTPWQKNFERPFEGSTSSITSFCLGFYNVRNFLRLRRPTHISQKTIWGYSGFFSVNYALSEVKKPARTLSIAGPLAILLVSTFYVLANLAYFAAATKEEILNSGRTVAALLFRNVWGAWAERVLSGFVAMSAFGNVVSGVRPSQEFCYGLLR